MEKKDFRTDLVTTIFNMPCKGQKNYSHLRCVKRSILSPSNNFQKSLLPTRLKTWVLGLDDHENMGDRGEDFENKGERNSQSAIPEPFFSKDAHEMGVFSRR